MITTIRFILLTAIRDWLFVGLIIGVVAAAMLSGILGGTALVEPEAMTISFAAASARVILIVGLIVFICFHIRQAFDSKEIDVLLSRPVSRAAIVVAYWLGFSLVALVLVAACTGVLALLNAPHPEAFLAWGGTLALEALIVVALALFAAFTLRSAVTSVIACLAFYVLSRMMGFFLAATSSRLVFTDQTLNAASKWLLELAAIIVPRLDFFAKSSWLVYGPSAADLALCLQQAAVIVPLLLAATTLDFLRKEF